VVFNKRGGTTALVDDVEKVLVEYLQACYDMGDPRNGRALRDMAHEIARMIARTLPDGPQKRSLLEFKASESWLAGFMRRNADKIVSRRAQMYERARASTSTPEIVKMHVQLLGELLEELRKLNGMDTIDELTGTYFNNLDESGFRSSPDHDGKVIVPAGQRSVVKIGEEKCMHVSGCIVVKANGKSMLPFMILPGERKDKTQLEDGTKLVGMRDGSRFAMAPAGNMNDAVRWRLMLVSKSKDARKLQKAHVILFFNSNLI